MDIAGFFAKVDLADLVIFAYLFGWFVLGFGQGAVRRVLGILTISFSFFLAAQLNVYVGPFLATHWTQFPVSYSEMIGFGALFAAGAVAFALIVQGTYGRVAVFAAHPIVDEVVGGVLGLIQGGLILVFVLVILDQFFLGAAPVASSSELPILRPLWTGIDGSWTGALLHATVIPGLITVAGLLIPSAVQATYGR